MGAINNKFWTDERVKDIIFEAMMELEIKRFPTCRELMHMDDIKFEPKDEEVRIVKGSHIHQLIARSGGYSGLAEEYKLDRLDSQGKLVRWNR